MEGTFTLAKGTKLKILIDQEGHHSAVFSDMPGSGGGGTFVTLLDDAPLIIAGEGGGGGTPKKQFEDGDPGQATENGTRCGGMGGNGGQPCNADTGNVDPGILAGGGGGAGLKGNGEGGGGPTITSSLSFINGGTGGICPASSGGFGGRSFGFVMGGGGGGYSGGGVVGSSSSGVAGGGGSYNIGTNQQNKVGVNKGDGKVIITLKN